MRIELGHVHHVAIVAEESSTIVRIYRDYCAGISPKAIAKQLNAQASQVRPARRGVQARSTAIPNAARESRTTNSTSGAWSGIAYGT
jgi:hypothetical protein